MRLICENLMKCSRMSPGREQTPERDRLPHYGPRFPPRYYRGVYFWIFVVNYGVDLGANEFCVIVALPKTWTSVRHEPNYCGTNGVTCGC